MWVGGYFVDWVMEIGLGFLISEIIEDVIIKIIFDECI